MDRFLFSFEVKFGYDIFQWKSLFAQSLVDQAIVLAIFLNSHEPFIALNIKDNCGSPAFFICNEFGAPARTSCCSFGHGVSLLTDEMRFLKLNLTKLEAK